MTENATQIDCRLPKKFSFPPCPVNDVFSLIKAKSNPKDQGLSTIHFKIIIFTGVVTEFYCRLCSIDDSHIMLYAANICEITQRQSITEFPKVRPTLKFCRQTH
jgi:hypothetical protein